MTQTSTDSTTWNWSIVDDLSLLSDEIKGCLSQTNNTKTPFLQLDFLHLLSTSKSVDGDSGWHSHHILICKGDSRKGDGSKGDGNNGDVIALIPCYLKTHSYGEYVFDHAWASAYHQHGLAYYPKLVCAVPFTPVTGARALIAKGFAEQGITEAHIFEYLSDVAGDITNKYGASSIHTLFVAPDISTTLKAHNMHERLSVQFVWYNKGYECLNDFMQQLTSRKRRSIRKERAPFVSSDSQNNSGLTIKTIFGDELEQAVVDAFYLCYQQTYFKRSGHSGYLSADFFDRLLDTMRKHVCIVAAFNGTEMIAGSLFFYNENSLFGRYWGALEEVSGLHFECCYYRGIEFAIENGIQTFNPGTQGEHKILRGFEPTFCYSNHFMKEPAFDKAVADFVGREKDGIVQYHANASELLPFKRE